MVLAAKYTSVDNIIVFVNKNKITLVAGNWKLNYYGLRQILIEIM